MAKKLGEVLEALLREIGMKLSIQECRNFIVEALPGAIKLFKRGDPKSKWFRAKEISRRNAAQSLCAPKHNDADSEALGLPYQYADNFKLLGLTLDIKWASHDHIRAVQRKLKVPMVVLRKASNSSWGLENCNGLGVGELQ